MPTISFNYQTLHDLAAQTDGCGRLIPIVEMMSQVNAIIDDLPMIPCNSGLFHKASVRAGLPSGTFRKLYGGVMPEKSTKLPVVDTTCMLEAYSDVDCAEAKRSGNPDKFRLREAKAFIEGLSQSIADILFYGDVDAKPEVINGLGTRYNKHQATDNTKSTFNVLSGAGANSDNTSIWLINWGEDFVTGIYPTGGSTTVGVEHENIGKTTKVNSDGSMFEVFRDHFLTEFGIHVADWRRVVRIANLKTANFGGASAPDIISLMRKATYRIPGGASSNVTGRLCWYMNGDTKEELERQYFNLNNMNLTTKDADGKPVMIFRGIPVKQVDQIRNDEATVGADS